MPEDFSNEGLYRLLERMDREHGADLKEIRTQTTETNSRVKVLESRTDRNDQELKRLNSAVFPRATLIPPSPPAAQQQAVPEGGEALSVKMSPKVWAAIYTGGGAVLMFLIEWAKQRMAQP